MEPWGAALYGDPCEACGFDWSLTPQEALGWVSGWGPRLAEVTAGAEGTERRPPRRWSVTEYVCHVGDNLRQWSERVQSALLAQQPAVGGYDPDALAAARGYAALPLPVAAWSSRLAATTWVEVLGRALHDNVELQHVTRGTQTAADVARNNCHDAHHHLWDIEQILSLRL
ncbi:hypothetical protein [Actinoplanes friuliensis]|uniref:DinB-like domain-containing protein n=1 Tax=Actinoplanes friuliensis DSM 7358 TaxID=1246995 RepID=U5VUK8_9ACTN|nr:hypothetical protein [Actinoplanes friuliensis]AGZ40653.1 hypothetical protein AFR_11820 [Actinoplanes friuliensis DSM 7358]